HVASDPFRFADVSTQMSTVVVPLGLIRSEALLTPSPFASRNMYWAKAGFVNETRRRNTEAVKRGRGSIDLPSSLERVRAELRPRDQAHRIEGVPGGLPSGVGDRYFRGETPRPTPRRSTARTLAPRLPGCQGALTLIYRIRREPPKRGATPSIRRGPSLLHRGSRHQGVRPDELAGRRLPLRIRGAPDSAGPA